MTSDYELIASSGNALLAWLDNRVVGMIVTTKKDAVFYIQNLAVSPEFQGFGLGSALLEEAERLALRHDCKQALLYTNEAMVDNISYYRKRGYKEIYRAKVGGYRRVHFVKQLELRD